MPMGLTYDRADELRKKIKRMGNWMGVRWMRNQGVPFEQAYYVRFGCLPRI